MMQAAKLMLLLAAAVFVGVALTMASALAGHEILVRIYGENLAPLDDTFPLNLAVAISYLIGATSAVILIAFGSRRLLARR